MEFNENVNNESKMGVLSIYKGLLLKPMDTFEKLKDTSKILIPSTIMALSTAIFTGINAVYSMDTTKAMLDEMSKSYDPQTAQMMKGMSNFFASPIFAIVSALIGVYIGWLLISLIYYGVMKIVKGEGKYKQSLMVYAYSFVPIILGYIIKIIVIIATGKPIIFNNSSLISAIFNNMDIFMIWQIVLLVIGYAKVFKVTIKNSAIVIVFLNLIYLIYRVFTALSSAAMLNK